MSFWALVVSNSGASSDRAIAVQIEMQSQFSVSSQCPMRSNSLSLSPWSLLPTQKKEKGCVRGSITLLAERILLCKPIGRFTLFNESLGQCRKVLGRKRRYLNPILSRLSQKSEHANAAQVDTKNILEYAGSSLGATFSRGGGGKGPRSGLK